MKCQRFENTTPKSQKKKLLHAHESKISWRLGESWKSCALACGFVLVLGNHLLSCQARLGFFFVNVLYYLVFCSFKIDFTEGNKIILLLEKGNI